MLHRVYATFARAIAVCLAIAVGDVLRVRRAHVRAAMTRAGFPQPERLARRMYQALARNLLELIWLALDRRALSRVALTADPLRQLGVSRGAVLATAHTGNWDLTACAVAQQQPLSVVTKHLSVGVLDLLWQRLRRHFGVELVSEGRVAQRAARALARGDLVAMMIDQVPMRGRAVAREQFLGQRAPVDLAPALVAMRARVPMVVAFAYRDAAGTHQVAFKGVLTPPRVPSRGWAEEAMRTATVWLDEFVREHPEQWLWMHRRWTSWEERGEPGGRRAVARASGDARLLARLESGNRTA